MTRISVRFIFSVALLALFVLPFTAARAQDPGGATRAEHNDSLTPAQFATELRQINARLDSKNISSEQIASARASIPNSWEIDSAGSHYSVSSRQLVSMLRIAQNNSALRAEQLVAARAWLSDLSQQVEQYSDSQAGEDATSRVKAKAILARRQFAGVGTSDPRAALQRKINEWLQSFFAWLFGGIGRHPIATETFFWLIVGGIVAWLSMMLFRFWMRGAKLESIEKISTVAFHRPWQEWIRAAREAAARGDFREAVHSTYWAGISRLETLGALEPDLARTPRESLRVLDDLGTEGIHATTQQRESLAALTVCLERVWYGHRAAGANDFQDCLRQAEELGCRVS
jgi:Domain of unknown function (DUF4129)